MAPSIYQLFNMPKVHILIVEVSCKVQWVVYIWVVYILINDEFKTHFRKGVKCLKIFLKFPYFNGGIMNENVKNSCPRFYSDSKNIRFYILRSSLYVIC